MSAQPNDSGNLGGNRGGNSGRSPGGGPSGGRPASDLPDSDLTDFGFATEAGNAAMIRLLADLEQLVHRGEVDRPGAVEALSDGVRRLGRDHPEATEMPVRIAVVAAVDPVFAEHGWEKLEPAEF